MGAVIGASLAVGDVLELEGAQSMKIVRIEPYKGLYNFLCGLAILESESPRRRVKLPIEKDKQYTRVESTALMKAEELQVGMRILMPMVTEVCTIAKIERYQGGLSFLYGTATIRACTPEGQFVRHYKLSLEDNSWHMVVR